MYSFYSFFEFVDYLKWHQPLLSYLKQNSIKGTLILAEEGINGTIAGTLGSLDKAIHFIESNLGTDSLETKRAYYKEQPFLRARVRVKEEIVTMGIRGLEVTNDSGEHLEPKQWNQLLSNPEVLVLDVRNRYETKIGTFKNAVNLNINTFRQYPEQVEQHIRGQKQKPVAMFCTGGIRCEKSTAYLKRKGFSKLYQLRGGILNYIKHIPEKESLWQGECFVFDDRVSVKHDLSKGIYSQCFACRHPVSPEGLRHPYYVEGISCSHCYQQQSDRNRQRCKERQKQILLARQRGKTHLGCYS